MELGDYPDGTAKQAIDGLFERHPSLQVRYSEFDRFRATSSREPHLESSYVEREGEGKGLFDVLCLYYEEAHLGSLSFYLEENEMRKVLQDHFARIDIVIVEKAFRNKGVGNLLVLTVLKYLLDRWGPRIYSISCLAAHDAMVRILEEAGFQGEQGENESFKRETISFSEVDQADFSSLTDTRLAEAIQLVHYRLRQPAFER